MEARPAPRGPLLIPVRRILLAILWRSVTMFDMVECFTFFQDVRALSGSRHCRLVEILKRTACF
eukprot:545338-Pelagomonas_calceolata.AAC.1